MLRLLFILFFAISYSSLFSQNNTFNHISTNKYDSLLFQYYYDTLGRTIFKDKKNGQWQKNKLNDNEFIKVKFFDNFGSMKLRFYYNGVQTYTGEYKSDTNCKRALIKDSVNNSLLDKTPENSPFGGSSYFTGVIFEPKRHGKWQFYRKNKIYKTIIYKEGTIISQK